MSEELPPLDPSIAGPLREADPAPPAVRARARQRLMTTVGGLGGSTGTGGGAAPAGSGPRTAASNMTLAVVAFVLGGVVGAGLYAVFVTPPVPRIVYVNRVAPSASPSATATATATATALAAEAPTASLVTQPSAAPSSRASQLSAERILLDEARAALARRDPLRALDRLERHRRTFSAPLLGEERDAMWVEALVEAGRYDEARARATAFRKRSPDSLFSSLVDSAIESIP